MKFVGTKWLLPHKSIDNVADPDTLVKSIVGAAQHLDKCGVRPDVFGIQFIQMGMEEVSKSVLRILGDDFGAEHNVRVCRQLVVLAFVL